MKIAIIAALAASLMSPALAQETGGTPLLRVYIDAPYYYEILASVSDSSDPRAHVINLLVEGKEVGESRLVYDCETGDYSDKLVSDWTGGAELYIPAALMAYHHLFC
jgi:hypothetical protein